MPALKFICRDVHLRVERSDTPFTRGYNAGQVIRVPVAHGEGNYSPTTARSRGSKARAACCSAMPTPDGKRDPKWNVNGAINAIAGISTRSGNVLGLMPHPGEPRRDRGRLHRRARTVRRAGGAFRAERRDAEQS